MRENKHGRFTLSWSLLGLAHSNSSCLRLGAEDEQFEADKAQVVREIAALEPKEGP